MKDATSHLKERIHSAFPVTHQTYRKLLGLLDIVLSREVPTAAVSIGPRPVMKINPDFLETHCRTDAALTMLVLHETMHVLLGHTRLYERITEAQNIAFDAVINATLCRMLPSPEYTALFRELYAADRMPEALLRPPDGVGTPRVRWNLEGEAGRLHRALYQDDTVTTGELLAMVESAVTEMPPEKKNGRAVSGNLAGRLLGSHAADTGEENPSPELLEGIRELISGWPREEIRSGRDLGGAEEHRALRIRKSRRQASVILRSAILRVALSGTPGHGGPANTIAKRPSARPWKVPEDRRAAVLETLGQPPLLWHGRLEGRARAPVSRTHVYLDVSGSVATFTPLLYGAILQLGELVHPLLHLFSTEVDDIPLAAFRRGKMISTWGTDIACVTAHLITHRIRRTVIITDGRVGELPEEHRSGLRRLRAVVVLTHGGDPRIATALGAAVAVLPPLE